MVGSLQLRGFHIDEAACATNSCRALLGAAGYFSQGRSRIANTKTCQAFPISDTTILFTQYTHTGKEVYLSQGGENLNNIRKHIIPLRNSTVLSVCAELLQHMCCLLQKRQKYSI